MQTSDERAQAIIDFLNSLLSRTYKIYEFEGRPSVDWFMGLGEDIYQADTNEAVAHWVFALELQGARHWTVFNNHTNTGWAAWTPMRWWRVIRHPLLVRKLMVQSERNFAALLRWWNENMLPLGYNVPTTR